MKKTFYLLFVIMLCGILLLTGCGKGDSNKSASPGDTSGNKTESENKEGAGGLSPYRNNFV